MASITSPNDFVQEYNIPNRSEPMIAEAIQWYIDKYETVLLTELLGDTLYTLLKEGLIADPVLVKWADLSAKCKNAIIGFVYWNYRFSNTTQTGNIGETAPTAENADIVTPLEKMIPIWNEMVRNNIECVNFINANTVDYGVYYNQSYVAYCGTLYGFGSFYGCTPWIFEVKNIWGL